MKWLTLCLASASLSLALLVFLPPTAAMPFTPFENDTYALDDQTPLEFHSEFARQLWVRNIDEQEAIAFANVSAYRAQQGKGDDDGLPCVVNHMAPYIPVMPNDNLLEMFHQDEGLDDSEGDGEGTILEETVDCPPYDASKFGRRPRGAMDWWRRQQRMDQKAIEKLGSSPLQARFPQAPRFVNYQCCGDRDGNGTLGKPEEMGPINVMILGFFTIMGPEGSLEKFFMMSVADRRKYIHSFHAAGISVLMSTFGGDDKPPIGLNYDPVILGQLHGEIARESGFDGIDNDFEDFAAADRQNHDFTGWMEAYVEAVRAELPVNKYALSAAPIAPWFATSKSRSCSGLYRTLDKKIGHMHDWYNLQYYSQSPGSYATCESILTKGDVRGYPGSSVFEIHEKGGVDLQKLVIGKPSPGEVESGYMPPARLAKCVEQAKEKGWKAGVMTFEFPGANADWFKTIRGKAFPPNE